MLWICKDCTCGYSVGAPKCPHCGSKKYAEEGSKAHLAMLAEPQEPAADDTGAEVAE
jgi:RNA polymerase subunit RPABC4/transcription elongation factor Spt4